LTDEGASTRPGRPEDLVAVLELWASSRSALASTEDRPADVERLLLPGSPAALLVAELDGQVVGAVIAAWDGWRGNIYRLAVADRHRRGGVGERLVRAAEARLMAAGARRVTALVAREDPAAAAFWDAVGYPEDEQIGRRVRNLPGAEPDGAAAGDEERARPGVGP
jgi:ribosomal protein S18 acetylase RimI-like enzyme